jgi:hypothetical protein
MSERSRCGHQGPSAICSSTGILIAPLKPQSRNTCRKFPDINNRKMDRQDTGFSSRAPDPQTRRAHSGGSESRQRWHNIERCAITATMPVLNSMLASPPSRERGRVHSGESGAQCHCILHELLTRADALCIGLSSPTALHFQLNPAPASLSRCSYILETSRCLHRR